MPNALVGLIGLAVVIAVAVGVWRWAHRHDWVEDDGVYYYEEWEDAEHGQEGVVRALARLTGSR